jgi:hypothetical protein
MQTKEDFMGEFYTVVIDSDLTTRYFKNRDNAFAYLWQEYLNEFADMYTEEELEDAKEELNYLWVLGDFGFIEVCGFEY